MTAMYDPSLAAEFDLPTTPPVRDTPSTEQAVRNLIGRVIARTCEPGTDHEAYQLADAARRLLAENMRLATENETLRRHAAGSDQTVWQLIQQVNEMRAQLRLPPAGPLLTPTPTIDGAR